MLHPIRFLKARHLSVLLCILCFFTVLSGCGQKNEIKIDDFKDENGTFCIEGIPVGTDYDTVYPKYASPEVDPESDNFEDWRNSVISNGHRTFSPTATREMYGKEWRMTFEFDETGALDNGGYGATLDEESFQTILPKVLDACYHTFGEPASNEYSKDEFTALFLDKENDKVSIYWKSEGTYLTVISIRTAGKLSLNIMTGREESIELSSGASNLPDFRKAIP